MTTMTESAPLPEIPHLRPGAATRSSGSSSSIRSTSTPVPGWTGYLALAILATVVLYYTYYTQTGVTPNILRYYHMSFSFYVGIVIVSNIIGAFASLPASKTDRLGRANVIIYGLLIVGLLLAVGGPNASSEWTFATVICAMGLVEGAILVATPALVRDFSPQLGRASAMGFWTVGPVAGSLVVSIVAAHTLSHFGDWQSQFIISGLAAVGAFLLSLLFMKDLSPGLRDQLMVSLRDRSLVEARARGLSTEDLVAATRRPWSQILKRDLIGAALGISLFLLVYYAASSFFTIYWSTTFKNPDGTLYSVPQANGLNQWFWGAEIVTLIVVGWLSDRVLVRKPFMLIGSIGAMVSLVLFLARATHPHTGHTTLIVLSVILAVFLLGHLRPLDGQLHRERRVEESGPRRHRLALWGWTLRLVVGLSFLFLPIVVHSVNPIIDNQPVATAEIQAFTMHHQDSIAFAQQHEALLQVIQEHQAVVNAVAADPSAANVAAVVRAIGAGNFAQLVRYETQLKTLVIPYQSQLNYLSAHQAQLQQLESALAASPQQWQRWYWVCFAGMVLFVPTIFLTKGRWSTSGAKADRAAHEEAVARELAQLLDTLPEGAGAG